MSTPSDFNGNPNIPKILSSFDKFAKFTRFLNILGILLLAAGYGTNRYLTVQPEIFYYIYGGVALILLSNFFFTYFYSIAVRIASEPNKET